jgi:hypothetical protein
MDCQYANNCTPPDSFLPMTGFEIWTLLILAAVLIVVGVTVRMRHGR